MSWGQWIIETKRQKRFSKCLVTFGTRKRPLISPHFTVGRPHFNEAPPAAASERWEMTTFSNIRRWQMAVANDLICLHQTARSRNKSSSGNIWKAKRQTSDVTSLSQLQKRPLSVRSVTASRFLRRPKEESQKDCATFIEWRRTRRRCRRPRPHLVALRSISSSSRSISHISSFIVAVCEPHCSLKTNIFPPSSQHLPLRCRFLNARPTPTTSSGRLENCMENAQYVCAEIDLNFWKYTFKVAVDMLF